MWHVYVGMFDQYGYDSYGYDDYFGYEDYGGFDYGYAGDMGYGMSSSPRAMAFGGRGRSMAAAVCDSVFSVFCYRGYRFIYFIYPFL